MYLNGEIVESLEDLEAKISGLSEYQKQVIRNDFLGIPNEVITPTNITAKQIRLALASMGISLEMIDGFINQMPEPDRTYAKITWEYATIFERQHPMIEMFGSMMGLTSEQIDNLFSEAGKL